MFAQSSIGLHAVSFIAGSGQNELLSVSAAVCLDSVPGTGRRVRQHSALPWLHPANTQQPQGSRGGRRHEVHGKNPKKIKNRHQTGGLSNNRRPLITLTLRDAKKSKKKLLNSITCFKQSIKYCDKWYMFPVLNFNDAH